MLTTCEQVVSLRDALRRDGIEQQSVSARGLIRKSIEAELRFSIARPDALAPEGQLGFAAALHQNPLSKKLKTSDTLQFLARYRTPITHGISKADLVKKFSQREALRIEVPAGGVAAAGILNRICSWQANILVECHYPMAYYFAQRLLRGEIANPPDAVVVGIVPMMHLMRFVDKHDYVPLMPLAVQSTWLLSTDSCNKGALSFYREEPTNMLFVEEKVRREHSAVASLNKTSSEIMAEARRGELENLASVVSPFGPLAKLLGVNATMVCGPGYSGHLQFLLVKRSLLLDERVKSLEIAIVRAWNEMIFDPRAIARASDNYLRHDDLMHNLISDGGLGCLSDLPGKTSHRVLQ